MNERIEKEIQEYEKAKFEKFLSDKKFENLQIELESLEDQKFAQDEEIRALRLKLKSMNDLDDKFLETFSKNQKLEIELDNVRTKNEGIDREIELLEIGHRDLIEELNELQDRKKNPSKVYCKNCHPLKIKTGQSSMKKPEVDKSESDLDSVYFEIEVEKEEAVNEINQTVEVQDFITLEPEPEHCVVIGDIQPNGNSKQDCITTQLNGQIQGEDLDIKSCQDFLKLAQKFVQSSAILKNQREKLFESDKSIKFPACPELNNLSMVDSTINSILSYFSNF